MANWPGNTIYLNTTGTWDTTSTATAGYLRLPVQVAIEPEPIPETPVEWLRSQVKEVCELAWAA